MRTILAIISLFIIQTTLLTAPTVCFADDELNKILQHFEERMSPINSSDSDNSEAIPYRLLKPEPLERGRSYPLVIFLHGSGQRGNDNQVQLLTLPALLAQPDYRKKYPCFLVAPQCPAEQRWQQQFPALLKILEQVIEDYPIDDRRIYLTGYSMGAFGTWSLASLRSELFAAAVPVAGRCDAQVASRLIDLPIWAVHGEADKVIPVSQTRIMIQAIRKAGGTPNYTELEEVGHGSWSQAYSDPGGVLPWLFAQKKPWFSLSTDDWPLAIMVLIDITVVAWLFKIWRDHRQQKCKVTKDQKQADVKS